MSKNQLHGKFFEKDFLKQYYRLSEEVIQKIPNTSIFDLPIGIASNENVSIKTTKSKCICLGDVKRIFQYIQNLNNGEKIKLFILEYKQQGVFKNLKFIYEINFNQQFHKELFSNINLSEIQKVIQYIKSIPSGRASDQCKKEYKKFCKILSVDSGKIKYNPKVDSKNQRRLQCSFDITKMDAHFYHRYSLEEFNHKFQIQLTSFLKSSPRKFK
jgi:hypothetical protein